MIAGHVQMMFATASSVVPHIRDGKVRPLAVATLKRTAVLPDIPTIDELGIKNFDVTTWHGLVAPAHTPKDVIATLNRALAAALDDPDAKTSLAALGVDVIGGTRRSSRLISSRKSPSGPRSSRPRARSPSETWRVHKALSSSLPGLTRQSISLRIRILASCAEDGPAGQARG